MTTLTTANSATPGMDVLARESAVYAVSTTAGFDGVAWLQRRLNRDDWKSLYRVSPGDSGTVDGPGEFRVWVESIPVADDLEVTFTQNVDVLWRQARANGEEVARVTNRGWELPTAGYSANGGTPVRRGYWADQTPSANVHRFRDRVFIGDGVKHSGNLAAPFGDSWLTERGANYFEKNSQVVVLGSESGRYGMTVGAHCPVGGTQSGIGMVAVALNEGEATTSRAYYAEAFHKGNAATTFGIEVQGGNYSTTEQTPTAYGLGGGYIGIGVGVVGGNGYVLGDASTPQTDPTLPATAAVDVQGGDIGASWQKWKAGIVIRNGALVRDGSNNATAIAMAERHTIEWRASASVPGARIRSDVTAVASQDVGLLFKNNAVHVIGTGDTPLATFTRDAAGAGGVNYLDIKNGRAAIPVTLSAVGSDTNIPIDLISKGTGQIRFRGRGGTADTLRLTFNADYVNYTTIVGSIAGAPTQISATGSDTNIDIQLLPKGTGVLKYGTHTALGAETVTGYITIRDAGGTLRKLAVVS